MKTWMFLLVAALALVFSFDRSSIAEELRWKLQKGDKFQLEMKQQTESLVNLSGKKLNSTIDLLILVGWDVTSADADAFVIEQTIDAVRMEMKGPEQTPVIYDSREKKPVVGAAKDFASAVVGLIGAKFKLTMTPLGAISSAERLSPPAEAAPAGDAAKVAVQSKETVEQLLKQPLLPLPAEVAGSDATWTDERQSKAALGNAKLVRTFTLAGSDTRDGKTAHKINVKGELTIDSPPKGAPQLKTQSHTGTAWFAKDPGRLLAAETSQRLVTESMYRDSTITVDLITTLSTTLTPRE
ncbi:hypothetical protein [Anatilimnocola floriformis]|uniref:hypothetical protein n=1 Tax=Anatilimnocola floriformis TaxID=2948575 RepID=UPI0020C308C5|nr:hypothetical protein [Anatilimnocola floriformis]